jgi:hypothetical protein
MQRGDGWMCARCGADACKESEMADETSVGGGMYEEVLATAAPVLDPTKIWTTDAIYNNISGSLTQPAQSLTFGPCNISINMTTGEVTIPEGLELSDAARAFWDMVKRIGGPPGFV